MLVTPGIKTDLGTVSKVLCTARILHDGWERDNEAWAVEFEDGSRAILWTSCGVLYSVKKEELEKKLAELEASALSIRELIRLGLSSVETEYLKP